MDIKNGLVRGFLKVLGGFWAARIDTLEITADSIKGAEIDAAKSNISNLQATATQLNSQIADKADTYIFRTDSIDLNNVVNGIHTVHVSQEEHGYGLPVSWYQLISTTDGHSTGIQTAFNLFSGVHYNRYLAGGTWSRFTLVS